MGTNSMVKKFINKWGKETTEISKTYIEITGKKFLNPKFSARKRNNSRVPARQKSK